MKLVMTLLVRDEADIIEANLEYHLAQGVDFVIVTDHGSEDGTSEILREYERMGVAKVIRDTDEGHHQSNRVTRMAEIARLGCGADWVIHNDADEFWWPLVGDLHEVFSSVPAQFGQIEVKRRNFRPDMGGQEPFYVRLVHREASSFNGEGHELEVKVAHRPHPDIVVAPGNHSIRGADLSALPAAEMLEIFHFPMRSYEQFKRKVVQIGHGYEQLPERSSMVGRDQLALLAIHREGKLRDYYDGLVLDLAALERGLQLGTIVVDRRLQHFMHGVRSGECSRARPDAPNAGAILRRTMDGLGELERTREQQAQVARARQAAAEAHERSLNSARKLLELEQTLARSQAQAFALEEELQARAEQIQTLHQRVERADRVMAALKASVSWRITAPLRALKRLI